MDAAVEKLYNKVLDTNTQPEKQEAVIDLVLEVAKTDADCAKRILTRLLEPSEDSE
jgi:hypothetical protein